MCVHGQIHAYSCTHTRTHAQAPAEPAGKEANKAPAVAAEVRASEAGKGSPSSLFPELKSAAKQALLQGAGALQVRV